MRDRFKNWRFTGGRRRLVLFTLTGLQTAIALKYLLKILPEHGDKGLEVAIAALFAILFAWISLGFWTAVMGFIVVLLRTDRLTISRLDEGRDATAVPLARTAVVMPICNEDVSRVFAGLRATYRSLRETGELDHFDFYVLSDTGDPDVWVEEEEAWARWQRDTGDFDRIHYRRRRANIKRKTGNIADFCRRWGRNYRYMLVLDADSVMSGETVVRLARLMEHRREVGIIQTAPQIINRESLYARIQQFANHVYGPLFAAGLNFWQLGDGYYWGHNAIIRLGPFIEHCGLSRLSGSGPMGGEILSHDFVEAAFMRRAGWEVWLAYDLGGSYEETPPTLLDELKRDRRWSQGNLQHLRLLHTWGLRFIHRVMFLYGVMAYGSSLLWLVLLGLSTAEVVIESMKVPVYFSETPSLFPIWPVWHPEQALALLGSTAVLLFLPKLLGIMVIFSKSGQGRRFGGMLGVGFSLFLEILFSMLLAPVRMLFHSKYVFLTLLGREVGWGSQSREDLETRWGDAIRHHGFGTLLAVAWGGGVYWVNPPYLLWLSPILGSLLLAIPISVLSSRVGVGRFVRSLNLFVIPEEVEPPRELCWVRRLVADEKENLRRVRLGGFVLAVTDPVVNALHLALLPREVSRPPMTVEALAALREKALQEGPGALGREDKLRLLYDADSVAWLHEQVWQSHDAEVSSRWGLNRLSADARSLPLSA
jgi:membrane glycosyltransferase